MNGHSIPEDHLKAPAREVVLDDFLMLLRDGWWQIVAASRIDDTARVASTADFAEQPLVGGVLGSHKFSHERFIDNLQGPGAFEEYVEQNKQDAISLFAKTMSE